MRIFRNNAGHVVLELTLKEGKLFGEILSTRLTSDYYAAMLQQLDFSLASTMLLDFGSAAIAFLPERWHLDMEMCFQEGNAPGEGAQ